MRYPPYVLATAVAMISACSLASASGAVPVRPASVSSNLQTAGVYTTYSVLKARKDGTPGDSLEPCKVKRGEGIWIDVLDIDKWLQDPKVAERLPQDRATNRLVPFINGHPLQGVYPDKSEFYEYPDADGMHIGRSFHFVLTRTANSKGSWDKLLNRPVFVRPMELSIGFENGERMPTWVVPKTDEESPFQLVLIPTGRFAAGVAVIIGSFVIFLMLARTTDIIRDTTVALRPDGKRPYSLARAQMAFWFFLVIGSFFFLWIITGDMDTLTDSVLALIGISAGTALGSAFIDAGKRPKPSLVGEQPIDFGQPREQVAEQYKARIAEAKKRLDDLQAQKPTAADPEANQRQQEALREDIEALGWSADYFRWPPWKGVMHDLLSEGGLISFHRFQIFVWTLVLGIIFIVSVYSELAMPQFSAALLGLLGISAGTYVGFKLPEARK
ncbi:MAG TPA: hypothetical protein VEX43_18385 [Chthoniobacterales bacterium]|nr:hypothetical protein [Chthoniobacterales bacterium]